jgi:hypothetical protein
LRVFEKQEVPAIANPVSKELRATRPDMPESRVHVAVTVETAVPQLIVFVAMQST